MTGDGFGEAEEFGIVRERRPCRQRALAQRQLGIANQHGRIGSALHAQSFTCRTPAERTVERKMVRIQRLKAAATAVASKMLAITLDFPFRFFLVFIDKDDMDDSLAQIQSGLDG